MVDSVLEVQNIKLPDSGATTGANVFTSTGNVPTIGDSVVLSDSYYLQANLDNSFTTALPKNINFNGSTSPYWVFTSDSDWHVSGTGSNFSQGDTISDLKIHRAGIYLVNFSATGYDTTAERAFDISIRGVGSGSSTSLARSIGHLSIEDSDVSYTSASVSLIYKFNADDQINFYISSASGNTANLYSGTHFNICLIRPL